MEFKLQAVFTQFVSQDFSYEFISVDIVVGINTGFLMRFDFGKDQLNLCGEEIELLYEFSIADWGAFIGEEVGMAEFSLAAYQACYVLTIRIDVQGLDGFKVVQRIGYTFNYGGQFHALMGRVWYGGGKGYFFGAGKQDGDPGTLPRLGGTASVGVYFCLGDHNCKDKCCL